MIKLKQVLKQYRIEHLVQDDTEYKQVTISKYDGVTFRGSKMGREIGRKRQFQIDLKKYPNTLMFVRQGVQDGSIGIAPMEVDGCIATENMPMFSVEGINLEYLKFLLKSPYFNDELNKIQTTGSAQKSIHEREILEIEIPFPDIEQQEDIVQQLSRKKDDSLKISSELTFQISLVKKIRQQLLQDAVQGKLVKQDKNDEPASELLKKIKSALRQAQGTKKIKELPPIKPEEIPFDIPENWVWCRLGEIISVLGDGLHGTPNYDSNGDYYFINGNNLINGKIEIKENTKRVSEIEYIKYRKNLIYNTVFVSINGTLGNLAYYNGEKIILGKSACFFNLHPEILREYIGVFIRSSYFLKYAIDVASETTIKNVSLMSMRLLTIPLPPLSEQSRIVQKLEELMQYCNELEASIKESELQNSTLLQQVLREALRPAQKNANKKSAAV
jgi:type I restriction enzyme S subunit